MLRCGGAGHMVDVETKHASLDTLSVTIQALHVHGKQMTLAVFRQLQAGEEQKGDVLWGVVRYAIKDEGNIWLVFSHDGRLFKRALNLSPAYADSGCVYDARRHYDLAHERMRYVVDTGSEYGQECAKKLRAAKESLDAERMQYEFDLGASRARFEYESKLSNLTHLFIAV
jgi:hypothetical protein